MGTEIESIQHSDRQRIAKSMSTSIGLYTVEFYTIHTSLQHDRLLCLVFLLCCGTTILPFCIVIDSPFLWIMIINIIEAFDEIEGFYFHLQYDLFEIFVCILWN